MKSMLIIMLALLGLSSNTFASAIAHLDQDTHTITIKAHIYYYGPAANEESAKNTTAEINRYWNGGSNLDQKIEPFTITREYDIYSVNFDVTSEVVSEAAAAALLRKAPAPEFNFIHLLQGNTAAGDRSFMNNLCSNQGTWYLSDDLGKSTTAPHEFGHGFCLPHPDQGDWRGKGQPGIMCPRGTIVESRFQWNPSAQAGQAGGTLSPYTRRVIQENINDLGLANRAFDSHGNSPIVENALSYSLGRVY